eukprot:PITA_32849
MDTGSDVVWAPCTTNYTCNDCSGYITVFYPRRSSSHAPIKCADPKCKDLCETWGCVESFKKCSRICPHFSLTYGKGNATGRLLSDTLTLPLEDGRRRKIKHFAIGCSGISNQVAGIAGFGRGGLSMPSQLGPLFGDKFGYCLDYVNNNSKIVVGNKAVPRDMPLTYTPLLFNPVNPSASSHYYPWPRSGEFASQIGYRRAPGVEDLCYNVSGLENFQWPTFAFHFKGGSDMVVPSENSFSSATSGSADTFCLAMNGGTFVHGPAVLIGNIQQNNFYILYDREKNRLGFTQRACNTLG